MRDPVMLPTSRKIVDRSTIKSHLLSDSKDPFNRMALSIEEVVPGVLGSLLRDAVVDNVRCSARIEGQD